MISLLSSHLFIIFSFLSFSTASPLITHLLSLNCTQPSNQTLIHSKPIKALLENLVSEVTKTPFITSNISLGHDRFIGLMQCRLDLDPATCTLCAQSAVHTISTLCPNSDAITAWFDGCYIQYRKVSHHENLEGTSMYSCSNRSSTVDRVEFETALETLLLRLRTEVNLATHLGFSHGELKYGEGRKIYGLVECVRSLSTKECEVCVGKAIDELQEHCGVKDGGIFVAGYCLVRFEGRKFFMENNGSGSDSGAGSDSGGGSAPFRVLDCESRGGMTFKTKVVVAWAVGVACLVGVVGFAWLLERSIKNGAKVATLGPMTGA